MVLTMDQFWSAWRVYAEFLEYNMTSMKIVWPQSRRVTTAVGQPITVEKATSPTILETYATGNDFYYAYTGVYSGQLNSGAQAPTVE
jgi:hypothetical protein